MPWCRTDRVRGAVNGLVAGNADGSIIERQAELRREMKVFS